MSCKSKRRRSAAHPLQSLALERVRAYKTGDDPSVVRLDLVDLGRKHRLLLKQFVVPLDLGLEADEHSSLLRMLRDSPSMPFCSQRWYTRISVCLVHYTELIAGHWGKDASEAVARIRDPFAFVDAPASLA